MHMTLLVKETGEPIVFLWKNLTKWGFFMIVLEPEWYWMFEINSQV